MSQHQQKHSAMEQEKHKAGRPFEVRVDGARHGAFGDLRDAIDAAKIVKRERPLAMVDVLDRTTGQVLVEPD